MTRKELQSKLREFGCKETMLDDPKTLCAYYHIQQWLYANKGAIKDIDDAYVDEEGEIRLIIGGYDDDSGINMNDAFGW